MTTRQCAFILLLCFHLCRAENNPTRPLLRTRQDGTSTFPTTDHAGARSTINDDGRHVSGKSESATSFVESPPQVQRDLSSIIECQAFSEMKIPLIPASMKYLLHNDKGTATTTATQGQNRVYKAPSNAVLTFCLDRIYLDLDYILDIGTLVTDLDIECPHLSAPIHFLEPNFVVSVTSDTATKSRFFGRGKFPGEVHMKNEDILRLLVAGEACEFKVRAYHFDDALLIGQLRGDAFKILY